MKKGVIAGIVLVVIILIGVGVFFFMRNSSPNVGEDASLSGDEASNVIDNLDTSNMNILVAYYSHTGNTEAMAEEAEYNDLYTEAEANSDARPEFKDLDINIDDYDTIFVGYPIWWYQMPMIMYTFFDEYDLSGKTIVPFNTHEGSGDSGTYSDIQDLEPDATVLDGLAIRGGDMEGDQTETVRNWLEDLGFYE